MGVSHTVLKKRQWLNRFKALRNDSSRVANQVAPLVSRLLETYLED